MRENPLLDYDFYRIDIESDTLELTEDFVVIGIAKTGSLRVRRTYHWHRNINQYDIWIPQKYFAFSEKPIWKRNSNSPEYIIHKRHTESDERLN